MTRIGRRLVGVLNVPVWRTVLFVAVALGIGAAMLGTAVFGSTPVKRVVCAKDVKRSSEAKGDQCTAGMVRSPANMTDHYDRQVLSLGPSLYLTLGTSPSGVEPDLSGHGHNGFYVAGSGMPELTKLPNGDAATVFNGLDQYVQVPSAAALSITATGRFTIEAWIRPTVLSFPRSQGSGYVHILGKGTAGKQEYALRMYSYSNSEVPPRPNRISAYTFNLSGGKGSGAYFQDKIYPGVWIMVTFVVDSRPSRAWPHGYIAIYKDGHMRGRQVSLSQFDVVPEASDAPFRIATRDLESFFDGAIGKVVVYNHILTPQDILATYRAMVSPTA